MGQEEYNPSEEEINQAMDDVKKQMKDVPFKEDITQAMTDIAAQFGEQFEALDPAAMSDEEIIEKYERDGWTLVDTVSNAELITAEHTEGKETKIVGLGDRFLIFEREEANK